MKNEYRRLGQFKDSEFDIQTSWSHYGEQTSTVAMVVSGFWVGTRVDPSVGVIHAYKQAKRCVQLQTMLSLEIN
ncbi:MAG: hypothetical protein PVJ56_11260 [Desulfobacterales bacterium]|jgi:hypothetical protein